MKKLVVSLAVLLCICLAGWSVKSSTRPVLQVVADTVYRDMPNLAAAFSRNAPLPDTTCVFAHPDDSTTLRLDIYRAAVDSLVPAGQARPVVLFAFGGGFRAGSRNQAGYRQWFGQLASAGYTVVSIDYRLGLKGAGQKKYLKWFGQFRKAIAMGVEDMFTATAWLTEHGPSLGIDAGRIVLSGSSAGAIISLQCIYELYNGRSSADILPKGYEYAGVMSFAGAIFSTRGAVRFKRPPCPTLFFHGTADPLVPYQQIRVLPVGFFGSGQIAARYARAGYDYRFYRFLSLGHEVASLMPLTLPEQLDFLEHVVCGGEKGTLDQVVSIRNLDALQRRAPGRGNGRRPDVRQNRPTE
ncbi:MAG: alpha/beta hydrolase [Bacteroidales bacterium]|nr:alpha/beta hydrolase [Bacteroidales bacterium]